MSYILITVYQDRLIKRVAPSVAKNVAKAAMESGVARIKIDTQEIFDKTMKLTDLK